MNQITEFAKVDRLVSKGAMAVRARLIQRIADGLSFQDIFTDEELTDMLQDSIEAKRWTDAIGMALVLWSRDWSDHIGRDFVKVGTDPEYYVPSGI